MYYVREALGNVVIFFKILILKDFIQNSLLIFRSHSFPFAAGGTTPGASANPQPRDAKNIVVSISLSPKYVPKEDSEMTEVEPNSTNSTNR